MRGLVNKYPLGYEGYLAEKGLAPAEDLGRLVNTIKPETANSSVEAKRP